MYDSCSEQVREAFKIYSDSLKVQSDRLSADGDVVEAIALTHASIAALSVVMTLQEEVLHELEQER